MAALPELIKNGPTYKTMNEFKNTISYSYTKDRCKLRNKLHLFIIRDRCIVF